jgi:monothiol glutaredoxin
MPSQYYSHLLVTVVTLLLHVKGVTASFLLPSTFITNNHVALSRSPSSSPFKMSDSEYVQETADQTQMRIQKLVDTYPVLLFMKGTKLFPQCGFSGTAVQILNAFNIDFHTVDVLQDDYIRQGVKTFSQWPTIPQLYVAGEFVGGSDIMIQMYQSGELGEMIEKAKAEM